MKDMYKRAGPQWPVSKEELKERRKACQKEENIVSGVWLLAVFTFLFVCVALSEFIENLDKWVQTALIILFFAVLAVTLVLMFKSIRSRMRGYGLACPGCGKLFTDRTIEHALKTGKCNKCGADVVK